MSSYQWPADVLDPLLAAIREAHTAWHTGDVDDRAAFDRARLRYYELREQASRAFATANGWQEGARPFSPTMLREGRTRPRLYQEQRPGSGVNFDHTEFFTAGRIPVAFVVHNYSTVPEVRRLRMTELPGSWYWPGGTTAWLIWRP